MNSKQNKETVYRVNKEFIQDGNMDTFFEIFSEDFINHTAPPGSNSNREGVIYFFNHLLRPAFPDLRVEVHEMIAEGDKVATRKSFHATHRGEFLGLAPTGKAVTMEVLDIIQLEDGKYKGHWGILDLQGVLNQLQS